MASNVINWWFINYKLSTILEAIMLAIMLLVDAVTHQGSSVSSLSGRTTEFHARKQSNWFPMRTNKNNGYLKEKVITFKRERILTIPILNTLASYGE